MAAEDDCSDIRSMVTGYFSDRPESDLDGFGSRPNFVDQVNLLILFACELCGNVAIQPYQTPCGHRACKLCLEEYFGEEISILCPFNHTGIEPEKLAEKICQKVGLVQDHVVKDYKVASELRREKCYCVYRNHGCTATPEWVNLKAHQLTCEYISKQCPSQGCGQMILKSDILNHITSCEFAELHCTRCKTDFKRKDEKDHVCVNGSDEDDNQKEQTPPPHVAAEMKCYYFESCNFKTNDSELLKKHLEESVASHLEFLTINMQKFEQEKNDKPQQTHNAEAVMKFISCSLLPLEKIISEIAIKAEQMENSFSSIKAGGDSKASLTSVTQRTQEIETVRTQVANIEKQIKDLDIGKCSNRKINDMNNARQNAILKEMNRRIKDLEVCSYDGQMIWKIDCYTQRKDEAVAGRQVFIYSPPFFSAQFGYKMALMAYLNGDRAAWGKYLSVYFVLMKGEYDDILEFPLRLSELYISLIAPRDLSRNKHMRAVPDPCSAACQRPQTEMNQGTGFPEFALQCEVESRDFIANDSIYIRAEARFGPPC